MVRSGNTSIVVGVPECLSINIRATIIAFILNALPMIIIRTILRRNVLLLKGTGTNIKYGISVITTLVVIDLIRPRG